MPYYQLHPDIGINFQLNRVLTYGERAGQLSEIQKLAKAVHDFESWYTEWFALGQKAEIGKRYLHAAYAYRMAEFFLTEGRPEKLECYEAFMRCFYQGIPVNFERFEVPYEGKSLPGLLFQASSNKAVVLVHGGYDSFMEEFVLSLEDLPQQGYTVILFEGPGQGTALRRGLKFTHEWERPVRAILNHFDLSNVALVGISWGGYLAMRAAAFEPRIARVVAYDVCFDGFEVATRPMPVLLRQILKWLVRVNAQRIGNILINRLRKRSLLLDWAVTHGMYITGTNTPLDFYRHISMHTMRDISHLIRQDVLLLAGEEDHYIPLDHLYRQRDALVNARSVCSRVFRREEGGEQHCQVGNHQIAMDEIIRWLDSFCRPTSAST